MTTVSRLTAARIAVCLLLVGSAAGLAAASIKVSTERDKTADFASLRTYRWLPTPPYMNNLHPETRDARFTEDVLDAPIRAAIDRALAGRRYTPAAEGSNPDFYVLYYAAFGVGMNADVLGQHYGYLTGWGSPIIGATPTTTLQIYEQGTLIVDVLRSDRTTAIWRGSATGAVDRGRTEIERRHTIEDAAKKLFSKFPQAQK